MSETLSDKIRKCNYEMSDMISPKDVKKKTNDFLKELKEKSFVIPMVNGVHKAIILLQDLDTLAHKHFGKQIVEDKDE